jgi:AcrR family transcriptional regulator
MKAAAKQTRERTPSTKERILSTAEAIFARRGFAGASTREIAATAGVNISSLHYHWESKERLYLAVFENIYARILDLVRDAIPADVRGSESGRAVIEESMGTLFDFFADNPNVPRLLVHRLLEDEHSRVDIEADVFVPAWEQFANWMSEHRGRKLDPVDSRLFMLTVHSVVLLFSLDSRHFTTVLGGSARSPAVRRRVRAHIIELVSKLLGP